VRWWWDSFVSTVTRQAESEFRVTVDSVSDHWSSLENCNDSNPPVM